MKEEKGRKGRNVRGTQKARGMAWTYLERNWPEPLKFDPSVKRAAPAIYAETELFATGAGSRGRGKTHREGPF